MVLKLCLDLMKHLDGRLLHPAIQKKLRYSAVNLYLISKNPTDISTHLGVSRQSAYNRIKAHFKFGKQGLEIHKRGRPKGTHLLPWQNGGFLPKPSTSRY